MWVFYLLHKLNYKSNCALCMSSDVHFYFLFCKFLHVKLCIVRVKWCAFLFYILQVFACQMSKTWSKIRIDSANPLPFLLVLEVVKPWIFMVMTHNVVTWSEAAHKQQCIASQQIPGHTVSRQHDSRNIVECRINSSNKFSKPWVKGWPHTFENAGFETESGKAR